MHVRAFHNALKHQPRLPFIAMKNGSYRISTRLCRYTLLLWRDTGSTCLHTTLAVLLCAFFASPLLFSQHTPEQLLYRRTNNLPGNDFGGALPGNIDIQAPYGELDDGSSLVNNINIDRESAAGEGLSLAGDNFDLAFVFQFYDDDGVFSFTENFDDRVKVVATPIASSSNLAATGASQEHSNTAWNQRTYGTYNFGAGGWFNANIWLTEDGGGAQSAADIGFGYFNATSTTITDFGGIGYTGTFGVSSGAPAAFDTDANGESWGTYLVAYDPNAPRPAYDLAGVSLSSTIEPAPTGVVRMEISTDPDFSPTVSTYAATTRPVEDPATNSPAGADPGAENGPRAYASFRQPSSIAKDTTGNLFIADTGNHQIRMIDSSGTASTIAGSEFGFLDGLGPSARFKFPTAIAIGRDNNLYVADTFNHSIRKLTRPAAPGGTWTVTTLAGTGEAGYFDGAGTIARFSRPEGLTVDSFGGIFVADSANHRIRRITPDGIVRTHAGEGSIGTTDGAKTSARFNYPTGMAFDNDGNLFIADRDNHLIRRIAAGSAGAVSTIAGIGGQPGFVDATGTDAQFNAPVAITMDANNNLYVADKTNRRIRKITIATTEVSTIAGNGVDGARNGIANTATFRCPTSLILDRTGNLIVADRDAHALRRIVITNLSVAASVSGTDVEGRLDAAQLGIQSYVDYYVRWVDINAGTIQNRGLTFNLVEAPVVATQPASAVSPTAVNVNGTIDPRQSPTDVVFRYSTDANLLGSLEVNTVSSFESAPTSLVKDTAGSIYVTLLDSHAVKKVLPDGTTLNFAGSEEAGFADGLGSEAKFDTPVDLAIDAGGNIYVADQKNHRIRKVSPAGAVTTIAGSGVAGFQDNSNDATEGRLLFPSGVSIHPLGFGLAVADKGNNRIRMIHFSGNQAGSLQGISTMAGSGVAGATDGNGTEAQFNNPTGIAYGQNYELLVADQGSHTIRSIQNINLNPPVHFVSTLAGNGTAGFADGLADQSQFSSPTGVASDGEGNVYVADRDNHRLRLINTAGVVSSFAGSGSPGLFDSPQGSLIPATETQFHHPSSIFIAPGSVNSEGVRTSRPTQREPEVYLIDSTNNAIRSITRSSIHLTSPPQVPGGTLGQPAQSIAHAIPETLWPGATYYFQIRGTNERGESVGEILNFTTQTEQNIAIFDGDSALTAPQLLNGPEATVIDFGATPIFTQVERNFTLTNTGEWPLQIASLNIQGQYEVTRISASPANSIAFPLTINSGSSVVVAVSGPIQSGAWPVTQPGEETPQPYVGALQVLSDDPDSGTFTIPLIGEVLNPPITFIREAEDPTLTTALLRAIVNPQGSPTSTWFAYSRDPELNGVDVTTIAGSTAGFLNGPSEGALFNEPLGLATDTLGNIYVADAANHRIRMISTDGTTITVAGSGIPGFADGPGAEAQFNRPSDVIFRDGTLYVADSLNHRIRAIAQNGTVRTLAGTGEASFTDGDSSAVRFNRPSALAMSANGTLYVADHDNHRIRIVFADGSVTTLAGTGLPGSQNGSNGTATLNQPLGLTIDPEGSIFFTETGSSRVRRIFNGEVSDAFDIDDTEGLYGIAANDSGNVFVTLPEEHLIYVNSPLRDSSGSFSSRLLAGTGTAGSADGMGDLLGVVGTATAAQFNSPSSITVGPDGILFVGDSVTGSIRQIASNTVIIEALPDDPSSDLSGFESVEVSRRAENLVSHVPYFFRAIATNAATVSGQNPNGSFASSDALLGAIGSSDTAFGLGLRLNNQGELDGGSGLTALPVNTFMSRPRTPFETWQFNNFSTRPDYPAIAAANNDANADSVINLRKYAHAIDPFDPSCDNLPVVSMQEGRLLLTYTRNLAATDLTFEVESSLNLSLDNWSPAEDLTVQRFQNNGVTERVIASVPLEPNTTPTPGDPQPAMGLRLRITLSTQP